MTFALAGGGFARAYTCRTGPTGTRFAAPFPVPSLGSSNFPLDLCPFHGVCVRFLISSEENRYGYDYRSRRFDTPRAIDPDKLNAFLGQAVGDMGAALHSAVVLMGDRLGLFRAMRDGTPVTSQQLSERTGVRERYVREWLKANAASKYVDYDAATDTYSMNPEQAFALAEDNTALDLPGFHYMLASLMRDEEKLTDAFREGRGFGWHEHDKDLFVGCERFFRPTYLMHLVAEWIPGADRRGGEAEGRCEGRGHRLRAWRVDAADGEGVSEVEVHRLRLSRRVDRKCARVGEAAEPCRTAVKFEVSPAAAIPGDGYDLVTCLRLPARHGRSGGCGEAHQEGAGAGRHLDDRRADRR